MGVLIYADFAKKRRVSKDELCPFCLLPAKEDANTICFEGQYHHLDCLDQQTDFDTGYHECMEEDDMETPVPLASNSYTRLRKTAFSTKRKR